MGKAAYIPAVVASHRAGCPAAGAPDDPPPPLSAKKLLGRTLRLYRRNFLDFIALSIVGPLAAGGLRLVSGGSTTAFAHLNAPEAAPAVLAALAGIAIAMAGAAVSSAATVQTVAAASRGEKVRVAESYRALTRRFWKIAGVVLWVTMAACCASVLCLVAGMIGLAAAAALGFNSRVQAGMIGYVCGGFSLLSAASATLWICSRYALAVPACVAEGLGCRVSLRRSALLTKGHRGRIAGVLCAILLLFLAADFVFGLPVLLLPAQQSASRIASACAGFLALASISPLMTIGMSLIYYDRSLRKENGPGLGTSTR